MANSSIECLTTGNEITEPHKCDGGCCLIPAKWSRYSEEVDARMYACDAHERYLEGWLRDMEHESRCDSRAAAHYEEAMYGYDD